MLKYLAVNLRKVSVQIVQTVERNVIIISRILQHIIHEIPMSLWFSQQVVKVFCLMNICQN